MAKKKTGKKKMTDKQRAALAAKRLKALRAWSPDKPKSKRCAPCKPGTSRAPKKASAKKTSAKREKSITATDILKNVAVKRGKRWTCGGPVRSGCGGSGSRVIGKVR
jgi:hypothetical protein